MKRAIAFASMVFSVMTPGAWADSPTAVKDSPAAAAGTLIGLSAEEIRAKFVTADWPIPWVLQIDRADGPRAYVPMRDLLSDPAWIELDAVYAAQGKPDWPHALRCRVLDGAGAEKGPLLAFKNGKLTDIYDTWTPIPAERPPAALSRKQQYEWQAKQPRFAPYNYRGDALPLEDGMAFLQRWRREPWLAQETLNAACEFPPSPLIRTSPANEPRGRGYEASNMQGWALAPLAVTLPSLNAKRNERRTSGSALLATLKGGAALGQTPEDFARSHEGVRAYSGLTPGYYVLSIDAGGYTSNNVSNRSDTAMVGVRDGRIEWIAPSSRRAGMTMHLNVGALCLRENYVAGAVRRGCSREGNFAP